MLRSKFAILSLALSICHLAYGSIIPERNDGTKPVYSLNVSAPSVSVDVYTPKKDGELMTPWPMTGATHTVDNAGVPVMIAKNGKHYDSVISISVQLSEMSGADIESAPRVGPLSEKQKAALNWFIKKQTALPGGAIVWQNTFPHPFDDLYIKTPWSSAYSQADAIKALLVAYAQTHDPKVLELARKAGYAYGVPCEKGGLVCKVGDVSWYEEVPVPNGLAPLILNGDLYAVVMLHRLYDATHDKHILRLAEIGDKAVEKTIMRYDTGNWSIYQLRPKTSQLNFSFWPQDETYIKTISLKHSWSDGQTLTFDPAKPHPQIGGNGWGAVTANGIALKSADAIAVLKTGPLKRLDGMSLLPDSRLTISYSSPTCDAPMVGITDSRDGIAGYSALSLVKSKRAGDACRAVYRIRPAEQTWTTLNLFYHDWHTRLVADLATRTGDPTLFATAMRWENYIRAFDAVKKQGGDPDTIRPKLVEPVVDVKLDALVKSALGQLDPLKADPRAIVEAAKAWGAREHASPSTVSAIVARVAVHE